MGNIQLMIGDYVQAQNMWVAKPPLWAKPAMPETASLKFSIIDIEGFNARLKEGKTSDYKDIIMGVNDRFLVFIEGNAKDVNLFVDALSQVVKNLKDIK